MSDAPRLSFKSLTLYTRADDDRPVIAGTTDTEQVVLLLDPEYAEELAQIIAVGVTACSGDLMGEDAVWAQASPAVLAAVEDHYDTVRVPVLGVAR